MAGKPRVFHDDDKNITIRMARDLVARLDECRRLERDIPNRSEMIRRLVAAQLDHLNVPQPDPDAPSRFDDN